MEALTQAWINSHVKQDPAQRVQTPLEMRIPVLKKDLNLIFQCTE